MAKPVSTFFSDSEIHVAIQLLHLSEDDSTTSSGNKSAAGFEDDGSLTSRHRAAAAALIGEIGGVGANRRRRKPRSRSLYEIYESTKPIISGGGGIAERKWNRRNRRLLESEAVVASGSLDSQIDEACKSQEEESQSRNGICKKSATVQIGGVRVWFTRSTNQRSL